MQPQQGLIERAVALESAGRDSEAVELYREAALSPETPARQRANAWFRLGALEDRSGNKEAALNAWLAGGEAGGNADATRLCAFFAGSALAAEGRHPEAVVWFERALAIRDAVDGYDTALQWKLAASRVPLGEETGLPSSVGNRLEALAATEAGSALEAAGRLDDARRVYTLALDSGMLEGDSENNARLRLSVAEERAALRAGKLSTGSVEALHAEIWHALGHDDLKLAARLCPLLPAADAETAPRIGHMLVATAFRLETEGLLQEARKVYRKAADDESLRPGDRCNAAFRLGSLLAAEDEREAAIPYLRLAAASDNEAVRGPAILQLVHLLVEAEHWAEALKLADQAQLNDPTSAQLLAVRALQSRIWTGELPDYPEAAAEHLPDPDAALAGAWMDAAVAAERAGILPLAAALYEKLLTVALPSDIRGNVEFRLGFALDGMMKWTEAEPWLRKAAESPDAWPEARVQARYRLALLYYLLDRYEDALAEFDNLRSDAGASASIRAESQLKHGTCLLRLERLDEAERDFRTCRAIGGEIEVGAELLMAELCEMRGDPVAARDSYSRIIQHPQSSPLTKTAALQRMQSLPKH